MQAREHGHLMIAYDVSGPPGILCQHVLTPMSRRLTGYYQHTLLGRPGKWGGLAQCHTGSEWRNRACGLKPVAPAPPTGPVFSLESSPVLFPVAAR